MKIERDSLLFKIRYGPELKGRWANHERKLDTNLCVFFWKTLGMLFVGWPTMFVGIVCLAVLALLVVICGIVALVCANLLSLLFLHSYVNLGFDRIQIARWPRVYGVRVSPGLVVAIAMFFWFGGHTWLAATSVRESTAVARFAIRHLADIGMALGILAIAMLFVYGLIWFLINKEDIWDMQPVVLVREYVAARKARFCPRIEYVGFEQQPPSDE